MNAEFQPAWRMGLTLVELMVALTILLVLAAITATELHSLPEEGRRSAAANNARQINAAYLLFTTGGEGRRALATPAQLATAALRSGQSHFERVTDIEDVALNLARSSDLNDAAVWFIESDPKLAGLAIPRQVISGDTRTAKACALDFQKFTPKAWAFVAGLPASMTGSETPLFWTYGLDVPANHWLADSPWQGKGDHVAYLDGHVEWFEKLPAGATGFQFSKPDDVRAGIMPEVLNALGR